jgi:2-methylcitrate dehydratase PrpD
VNQCARQHLSGEDRRRHEEDDAPKTKARVGKTKYSADEIIEIMRNAEDDDKDEVIQKVFMASDF